MNWSKSKSKLKEKIIWNIMNDTRYLILFTLQLFNKKKKCSTKILIFFNYEINKLIGIKVFN